MRNLFLLTYLFSFIGLVRFIIGLYSPHVDIRLQRPEHQAPSHVVEQSTSEGSEAVPCIGPRGKLITESADDRLQARKLDYPYPTPFVGSFTELGLEEDWLTIDGRYGPYGYVDHTKSALNNRSEVDWNTVNWGKLQMLCQDANAGRFSEGGQEPFNVSAARMRLKDKSDEEEGDADWLNILKEKLGLPKAAEYSDVRTGKTALVLRAYEGYEYKEQDMINIRSLISEAGLQSGGEYTVVLYVNIKDPQKHIFDSPENYNKALQQAGIPDEFKDLAVLWDDNLLESWYPKVKEHTIMFQVNQALQLFALFYPEFDHHWQLELDISVLGHSLTWFRALDTWSRNEPRKHSVERASYFYFPASFDSYSSFISTLDTFLHGSASVWGPLSIPEIPHPIGPPPPTAHPEDDNFSWGVGESADLIVTTPCSWVTRMHSWVFRGWLEGPFSLGLDTPRMTCPPAIQRSSRQLLLAVHAGQAQLGLALPSEATLPSFALWHGLKFSFPPAPIFRESEMDARQAEILFNGGRPGECVKLPLDSAGESLREDNGGADGESWVEGPPDSIPWVDGKAENRYKGFACGEAFLNQLPRAKLTLKLSWWWHGDFPSRIMHRWTKGRWTKGWENETQEMDVLREVEGERWAPQGWLHPFKH